MRDIIQACELVDGYRTGFSDDREKLPAQHNYSPLYVFGWLNGRDDRIGKPRDTAENLRRELASIEQLAAWL